MQFESNAELVFWERCVAAMLRSGSGYREPVAGLSENELANLRHYNLNNHPSYAAAVADRLVEQRRERIPEYARQRELWPDHWREPETT